MSAARKRRARRLTGGEPVGDRWRGWVRATLSATPPLSREDVVARLATEGELFFALDRREALRLAAGEVRELARELGELARLLADSARRQV